MRFINKTGHEVVVETKDGTIIRFPPIGDKWEVKTEQAKVAVTDQGIPIFQTVYQTDPYFVFPAVEIGIYYIVSSIFRTHYDHRPDLVSPDSGPTAKRVDGKIVSVRGFIYS